jgi:hypothetical protein
MPDVPDASKRLPFCRSARPVPCRNFRCKCLCSSELRHCRAERWHDARQRAGGEVQPPRARGEGALQQPLHRAREGLPHHAEHQRSSPAPEGRPPGRLRGELGRRRAGVPEGGERCQGAALPERLRPAVRRLGSPQDRPQVGHSRGDQGDRGAAHQGLPGHRLLAESLGAARPGRVRRGLGPRLAEQGQGDGSRSSRPSPRSA